LSPVALAQPGLEGSRGLERILAIVPLQGAGRGNDPVRPAFAPVRTSADGITGYRFVTSDDGRFALVEFTATSRAAFAAILNDRRAEVKVFERGKHTKQDIEREFRLLKRDFSLDRFLGFGLSATRPGGAQ